MFCFGTINYRLREHHIVGRGHDPAEAPIRLSSRLCAKILGFTRVLAQQLRYLVGGVMTPPYKDKR